MVKPEHLVWPYISGVGVTFGVFTNNPLPSRKQTYPTKRGKREKHRLKNAGWGGNTVDERNPAPVDM